MSRLFRFYWFHWLAENPNTAIFLLILAGLMIFALLPLIGMMLPLRKVPLTYNLRNLQSRWITTLVTALAFTMVSALLTVMLAFVRGMDKLTEESGHPGNVLVLSDGATEETFSSLPPFSIELLPQELQKQIQRTSDGKQYLATQEVYVIVTYQIPGIRKRRFVQMRGLDRISVAAEVHQLELAEGDWPSVSGVREVTIENRKDTAAEVVLGDGVARLLGGDRPEKTPLHTGDIVKLGPRYWYVAGVMKPNGSSFGSEIWTRDSFVQENFGRNNSYSSYVVRTPNLATAKLATQAFKEFRSERNLVSFPEQEFYSKLTETNKQFSYAIYFVAIIMALGGMLGIMNTMFAAISQRTKDIGVLRLMGYRRWQILLSFQAESLLIAILGGILGCAIGSLFHGFTATSIVSSGMGGGKSVVLKLIVDTQIILTGMTFAIFMGAFGGLIPSVNAMRLRPLESLK